MKAWQLLHTITLGQVCADPSPARKNIPNEWQSRGADGVGLDSREHDREQFVQGTLRGVFTGRINGRWIAVNTTVSSWSSGNIWVIFKGHSTVCSLVGSMAVGGWISQNVTAAYSFGTPRDHPHFCLISAFTRSASVGASAMPASSSLFPGLATSTIWHHQSTSAASASPPCRVTSGSLVLRASWWAP